MTSKRELKRLINNLSQELRQTKDDIKELHGQLFHKYEVHQAGLFDLFPSSVTPTMKTKVDAIIEHLGLDISVKDAVRELVIKVNKPVTKRSKK